MKVWRKDVKIKSLPSSKNTNIVRQEKPSDWYTHQGITMALAPLSIPKSRSHVSRRFSDRGSFQPTLASQSCLQNILKRMVTGDTTPTCKGSKNFAVRMMTLLLEGSAFSITQVISPMSNRYSSLVEVPSDIQSLVDSLHLTHLISQ